MQDKAGKEHVLLDSIVVIVIAKNAQSFVVHILKVKANRQSE